jgi:hypothetical protein
MFVPILPVQAHIQSISMFMPDINGTGLKIFSASYDGMDEAL